MATKTMTEAALVANRANAPLGAQDGGRPPRAISPEHQESIFQAVREGVPPDAAAGVIGISKRTLYRWLELGKREDAEEPYASFAEGVDTALATWETRDITLIGKAAETQWQAAAWRLERRLVQKYGRRTRVEGNVTVSARPFIDVSKLTLDEQRQLRELLVKAQPDQESLPEDGRGALELMPSAAEAA